MTAAFLLTALLALLALGLPIAIALGLASVVTILLFAQDSLASLSMKFFGAMENYTLLAMPFFILSSAFLTTGGVARRLVHFATAVVGHVRGGLAIGSVLACGLFAAISGSSPATVVAIGSIVIAGMVKTGYSRGFAAGVICNAGTLGILIPPSIPMVVYAATTESSVGRLFMAGLLPGALLLLMLSVAIYGRARMLRLPRMPRASLSEVVAAGRDCVWGLLLIVVILGGIYGGIFTPTEAAAVAAIYAFAIAVFVYRDVALKDVPVVLVDAGKTSIMLMFIVANAMLFAHVLTTERIPQTITQALLAIDMAPWMFLIVINLILLFVGQFMEPAAVILIVAPILMPIAVELGIDPIHLGIVFVANMEIGMVSPPVGLNLFVTSAITGMPMWDVVKAALPWMGVLFLFLAIVTYVPWLSLALPDFLFGPAL